jgi:NAD(P)-dependent dehydrogenase (short-subunit alcohol dehydrogenase family)
MIMRPAILLALASKINDSSAHHRTQFCHYTMDTTEQKFALITGCSTGGIGWAMTKQLHQHGFYIFATARDTSKISDIDLKNAEYLELDVTIPSTIERCRDIVSKRTGGRLDVLVDNAGVEFNSPLLDTDVAEAKRLYEVNVWGPLLMVQAFAPLLIEAKGVVFNQSSIDSALNMVWAGKSSINHPYMMPLPYQRASRLRIRLTLATCRYLRKLEICSHPHL